MTYGQAIYGASDDLVEFVADGGRAPGSDEFETYGRRTEFTLAAGSAPAPHARLEVVYDDAGIWRVKMIEADPTWVIATELVPPRGEDEGNDEDGCPGYSEKLVLTLTSPVVRVEYREVV